MSTAIEWTDETWNPVTGCTKVSPGCKNCYAERLAPKVFAGQTVPVGDPPGPSPMRPRVFTDVICHPERLDTPLHWRKPRRIFVNSMSDLFHEDVPDDFIDRVFRIMQQAKLHSFQILTKRAERLHTYMARFKPDGDGWVTRDGAPAMGPLQSSPLFSDNNWPPKNVWLGVSVEDQATADERIPLLLQTPAAVRFISAEPLLGPVNVEPWLYKWINANEPRTGRLDWVIAGGESGPNARPSHPDWLRALRDQCAGAGVPFFFKQWGEWAPRRGLDDIAHATKKEMFFPGIEYAFEKVGKKAAGRTLDGRIHDEYPA